MVVFKRILMIVLSSLCILQARGINGRIMDAETDEPLYGANVYYSGMKIGTVSDADGYFHLETINNDDTLVIRMMGYQSVHIPLNTLQDQDFTIDLLPSVIQGGDVIVSATRIPGSKSESTVSMDIIDQSVIKETTAQNIAELLQGVKALYIKDYGGVGGMKTLSLRGATAGQTLIMLDGQRINNPQNGEVDLSLIPLEHIERIEIVRGGASALYGSDALGGVINIITKGKAGKGIEVHVKNMIGSFGTYSFKGSVSLGGFLASYHYLMSDGDFEYSDRWGNTYIRDNNDIQQHHLYIKNDGSFKRVKTLRYSVKYDLLMNEKGAPGSINPYYHYARMEDDRHDLSFSLQYESENKKLSINSQSYFLHTSNHYINEDPRDVISPINDTYLTSTYGEEVQVKSYLSDLVKFNYGINLRFDEFVHQRLSLKYERFSYDAYVVNESKFIFRSSMIPFMKLTPSIRYNGNTDFSDKLTPKIGMLMKLGKRQRFNIISNAGLSFRSPTFNDLYWPEDSFSKGNPDLLPESGWDWDAGFRYYQELFSFESIIFDHHYNDLILWLDHGGLWWPENISKARIYGVENSFSWDVIKEHLFINGQYTWMKALDLSELYFNKYLTYRPVHSAMLSIKAKISGFKLNFVNQLQGKRYTTASNAEISALPTSLITDIGINYELSIKSINLDLKGDIKNVFDIPYYTLKDFPMPGREYRLSVGLTYNKMKKGIK